MRITRLSWTNYKGLSDGAIYAGGSDVIVSGQNGVGKSTIAGMFSFILFGLDRGDTLSRYEGGRKQADDDLIHAAQVEFDDGTTIRREICKGETLMIVNGTPMKVSAFKQYVNQLLGNADKLLFDPFYFHDDKRMGATKEKAITKRRGLLAEIFGKLDEQEYLTLEEAQFLGGEEVSLFIVHTKNRLKTLKKNLTQTENYIEEREHDKDDMPADLPREMARLEGQIAKLQVEKKSLEDERDKLNHPMPTDAAKEHNRLTKELDQLTNRISSVKDDINFLSQQKQNLRDDGQELKNKLAALKNAEPGCCPTCGQRIPQAQFEEKQKEQSLQITADGQKVNGTYRRVKKQMENKLAELKDHEARQKELAEQLTELSAQVEKQVANEERRKAQLDEVKSAIVDIEKEINAIKDILSDYKKASEADDRIAVLRQEQKQLHKTIAQLEGRILRAREIQNRAIQSLEEQINSNFGSVRFKLFDVTKQGEIFETCEAFMHDVPYSALSKGEKLKCALEVFRVVQAHYGVELPLIIDDAESYTLNSFVELPNQKWLFKVSDDGQLIIEVKKASVAA